MSVIERGDVEVVSVVGFAGDRTQVAAATIAPFCKVVAEALPAPYTAFGEMGSIPPTSGCRDVLRLGRKTFELARDVVGTVQGRGHVSVLVTPRCAVSLATLPEVVLHHPDVVVVWLDAHGDMNTPVTSGEAGYLGGMPVAAAMGEWDSGYGDGLSPQSLVLVGARNLDAAEIEYIQKQNIVKYAVGDGLRAWKEQVAFAQGRPIYVHIDVDAFDPSEVSGEYTEPNGLMKAEVVELLAHLAGLGNVVGVEVSEFEPRNPDEFAQGTSTLVACLDALLSD